MEPEQEQIAHIMEASGTTEDEARVLYHLSRTRTLLFDIHKGSRRISDAVAIDQAVRTLTILIAERVLTRQHPEYWAYEESDEETDS